jgi:uncharacterized cupin superfamily protein
MTQTMSEAGFTTSEAGGKFAAGAGWYVLNVDEAAWQGRPGHAYTDLQGATHWDQYGMGIDVLQPGVANGMYHREVHVDETFLVLDGEIDAIVDGAVHRVCSGDVIHCPAGTAHIFVGAGDRPSAIVMLGARRPAPAVGPRIEYLVDDEAQRLGAGVAEYTTEPRVAYEGTPQYGPVPAPWRFSIDRSSACTPQPPVTSEAGWFIRNLDASHWIDNGRMQRCYLDHGGSWEQYGLNVHVVRPGEPNCRYHREHAFDETMLVLDGTALALVEGEERSVRAGDVIHCPAGTGHVFVGTGDGPCAILMLGTRDAALEQGAAWGEYPVDELAARHGASVEQTTSDPSEAYAERPPFGPAAPIWTVRTPAR